MKTILGIIGLLVLFGGVAILIISQLNLTYKEYKRSIEENNEESKTVELITEEDLIGLPVGVQNYLNYVGVIGTEKVNRFKTKMTGEMKMDEDKEFSVVNVEQYSFIEPSARLFYMTMKYKGLKIVGLHHYEDGEALMKIKILDVFKVVDESGVEMNQAETVTFFNDMVLLAPGSLLDERIVWTEIDEYKVEGEFTNEGITVSATLYFDEDGKLINFVSEDRYAMVNGVAENIKWSTPIYEYKENNGLNLPYKGSAIWNYPDRDFEYIKLIIEDVVINP